MVENFLEPSVSCMSVYFRKKGLRRPPEDGRRGVDIEGTLYKVE